jgi:hypothetical protein
MSGDEELLHFHFRVVPLWHIDGRQFVEGHAISMYTLLPTMKNVDARLLLQAIDEMIQYYGDNERKLARRLFWLNLFLRRSEMITPEDKSKVQQRLDVFDQLIEEDEFILAALNETINALADTFDETVARAILSSQPAT